LTDEALAIANDAKQGTERANARLEAVRTGLAAGAGVGAATGLVLAFRRQHHQEIATALIDHEAVERRVTELYTKAVEQLGNSKAPVRLGGLYALERLANNRPDHRQTMMPASSKVPSVRLRPRAGAHRGPPANVRGRLDMAVAIQDSGELRRALGSSGLGPIGRRPEAAMTSGP
jgi:hypothetical protein